MIKQIKTLTALQLKNLYGWNVIRRTKDKKAKNRALGLGLVWLLLIVMICFYVGAMAFGYIMIGMAEILPAYFIMIASLIILAFAIFKAGSVIFQRNAFDILASLPVTQTAIVVSRFLRMYVENLMFTLLIMFPGMTVYGVMMKPKFSFYLIGVIATVFVPLLPMSIATFFGAAVTAVASRMKHKSLVSAVLSVLVVVGIMGTTPQMAAMEDSFSVEMLKDLSKLALEAVEQIYPPAIWFGEAMLTGNVVKGFLGVAVSLGAVGVTMALVSVNYQSICQRLYSTVAKHDYEMQALKKEVVLKSLLKKEIKRYFSSSVYVTNTIIGPILAVVFAAAVWGMGVENMQQMLELPMEQLSIDVKGMIPFVLATIFCMMGTTCTSISMEGKEWWIIKSLPLKTKDVLDSKLLLNTVIVAPFFLISEILLVLALKPTVIELLWLVLIPLLLICFSFVWGVMINLKMPVFNWENEVTVVKQSASSLVGGLGGMVPALVCMVVVLVVPAAYANLVKGIICAIVVGLTVFIYQKNNRVDLQTL